MSKKRFYAVFVGAKNVKTGSPNPRTQKMSCLGHVVLFSSKAEREEGMIALQNKNPLLDIEKTAISTAYSKYFAGHTQMQYLEKLASDNTNFTFDDMQRFGYRA